MVNKFGDDIIKDPLEKAAEKKAAEEKNKKDIYREKKERHHYYCKNGVFDDASTKEFERLKKSGIPEHKVKVNMSELISKLLKLYGDNKISEKDLFSK